MNKFTAQNIKRSFVISFALFFIFVSIAVGQPNNDAKLAQAKIAYDEGIELIQKRTAESYNEAYSKFKKSSELYGEAGDTANAASSLLGMGFSYNALGRKTEAINIYLKAITVFNELSLYELEARSINNVALIYADLGDNQKALDYLLKSLPLRKKADDLNGEAVTLNSIGFIYKNLGQIGKALDYHKQALKIRTSPQLKESVNNKRGQASILNNIGKIYQELGETEKALDYLNQSLKLRRELDDKPGEAITLNNIAIIYQDLDELQKSLNFYEQSLAIFENIGDKFRQATALNNIGQIYSEKGENRKALDIFFQALELHRKFKHRGSEAVTLNNIANEYFNLKQYQKGFGYLNLALAIQKAIGDTMFEANSLNNLMFGWNLAGNNQLAIFYGKQSVNKYQELRRSIESLDVEIQKKYLKTIEHTYRQLVDLLIADGRYAQAEQVLRMLKEEEYFDFVRRDSDEIKTLDQRVSLNEKEKKLIGRYSDLSENIAKIGSEFEELDKRKDELSDIEQKRYEELEKQIADANAAFKLFLEKELVAEFGEKSKQEIEFDRELQVNLKKWGDGTVTLYTVVTENRYRVILTTPNVQIDGKTEISAADLNKKIFAYREALQKIELDPRPLGKELYDILIKPIEKDLKAANAKTLVWSLDGTLRYIPLATLSPDGKTYLVEKYRNVITTPQTKNDVSDLDTEWRALGVGVSEAQTVADPDDTQELIKFSSIPGTKEELFNIVRDEKATGEKGILEGRRFLDKDFTIKSLSESLGTKNADGKRKYTAVHIASHFQLGSNWANSFLLLGNGQILTLKELKTSPELNFGDVELVTLSACDTAFTADSNGKEIDSLAEVIQTKRGKAVLAALWAVVDESTPLLMSEFYRLRKENPQMTKAEAMQIVQKAFITGELKPDAKYIEKINNYFSETAGKSTFIFDKNAPFAHPYFWSPFVLIGNWR